jgi:hypothetical protein
VKASHGLLRFHLAALLTLLCHDASPSCRDAAASMFHLDKRCCSCLGGSMSQPYEQLAAARRVTAVKRSASPLWRPNRRPLPGTSWLCKRREKVASIRSPPNVDDAVAQGRVSLSPSSQSAAWEAPTVVPPCQVPDRPVLAIRSMIGPGTHEILAKVPLKPTSHGGDTSERADVLPPDAAG